MQTFFLTNKKFSAPARLHIMSTEEKKFQWKFHKLFLKPSVPTMLITNINTTTSFILYHSNTFYVTKTIYVNNNTSYESIRVWMKLTSKLKIQSQRPTFYTSSCLKMHDLFYLESLFTFGYVRWPRIRGTAESRVDCRLTGLWRNGTSQSQIAVAMSRVRDTFLFLRHKMSYMFFRQYLLFIIYMSKADRITRQFTMILDTGTSWSATIAF